MVEVGVGVDLWSTLDPVLPMMKVLDKRHPDLLVLVMPVSGHGSREENRCWTPKRQWVWHLGHLSWGLLEEESLAAQWNAQWCLVGPRQN